MIGKVIHGIGAIILGVLHVVFADILFFYGKAINPEAIHKTLNTIAFILKLPFSPLLFIPNIGQFFIFVQIVTFSFWIIVYYWLILKVKNWCCSRKEKS